MNANALIDIWPQITAQLKYVLGKYYQKQEFETDWPEDIERFLILLRLLPFKQGCRSLASTETFQNCVKRLLIFSNVLLLFLLSCVFYSHTVCVQWLWFFSLLHLRVVWIYVFFLLVWPILHNLFSYFFLTIRQAET